MDDLVQRADLGVPEGGERRQRLAEFIGFAETFFDFAKGFGFDVVRAHFVNHGLLLRSVAALWSGDITRGVPEAARCARAAGLP